MESRVLLGLTLLTAGLCFAPACGGQTGDERADQSSEGSAASTGSAESAGDGGSANAAGTGSAESGGSSAGAAGGGTGGFAWTGYDVYPIEIDEAASGTPVAEGEPGNDYGSVATGPSTCPLGSSSGYGLLGRCMDFEVCGHACTSDADCPPVTSGTTTPQCRDPWPLEDCDPDTCFHLDRCSLPCGGDLVCPDGMACVGFTSGFLCAWPNYNSGPIVPQDCPGYCQLQDGPCDSRTGGGCCRGYVCAPWDACEAGSCLQPSWPCSENTAPCCEDTACVDGVCT